MDFTVYPCYSYHNRPHYQWTLSYTPATAGTSGHIANGLYCIPLPQLTHQTILPMDFTVYHCYSRHIRLYYQWTLLHTPATAGTSGHITNGFYCIPLLQLAHQAILPMDFTVYPCYSWHIMLYYQWTLLYTPATAGTSGHISNGLYCIPLLQLAHQTIFPMDFTVYPCYSWHIRPHYQWTLLYTPATAGTSCYITNGLYCIPLLQLAQQATLPVDFTVYPCYS
jgi:8-oxo-dGTP pyrophosphatase MutT (NUDIX family)